MIINVSPKINVLADLEAKTFPQEHQSLKIVTLVRAVMVNGSVLRYKLFLQICGSQIMILHK